ncbi:hypothetical protein F511_31016 [Dorcoceras hygrometricum]|uniref:Uncharacterized protein n=1 Tax=Dorcoceras hygrometricum TaxID=472368 RepID=A0A2Z7AC01_9LAMI|nr:hypothetical protein F511_31016 [Dorcoceras hygrometricum]
MATYYLIFVLGVLVFITPSDAEIFNPMANDQNHLSYDTMIESKNDDRKQQLWEQCTGYDRTSRPRRPRVPFRMPPPPPPPEFLPPLGLRHRRGYNNDNVML